MTKDLAETRLANSEVSQILELLNTASLAILKHYRSDAAAEYQNKKDSTPLTEADLMAHRLICQGLRQICPEIPVLSEESDTDVKQMRRQWRDYWLVDPLDGTREFLNRTGEFTINIALIREHRPVLGFIAAPCLDTVWFGGEHYGAYKLTLGADLASKQSIRCRVLQSSAQITVLSAIRHRNKHLQATLSYLRSATPELQRLDSGSALKFCQLAEGRGDIYPRFSPCCEWDTGAGQALVEGAGGQVWALNGQPLAYNSRDTLMSPHFVALADPSATFWIGLLQELKTSLAV